MEHVRKMLLYREQTFDLKQSSDYYKKLMLTEEGSGILSFEQNLAFKAHLYNTLLTMALQVFSLLVSLIFPLYESFTKNFLTDLINILVIVLLLRKFMLLSTVVSYKNDQTYLYWAWSFKV